MDPLTQIKTTDLLRIRQAVNTLREILDFYPSKVEPLTTADRDKRYATAICLWCDEPLGKRKHARGCHEYCITLAKAQADDSTLVQLNRIMPATKGGRPTKRINTALSAVEAKANGKKNQ